MHDVSIECAVCQRDCAIVVLHTPLRRARRLARVHVLEQRPDRDAGHAFGPASAPRTPHPIPRDPVTRCCAGAEIIQHEVSVPSFTVMLGSCLCFAVAEAGRVVLVMRLSATLQAALDGAYIVMLGIAACVVRPPSPWQLCS